MDQYCAYLAQIQEDGDGSGSLIFMFADGNAYALEDLKTDEYAGVSLYPLSVMRRFGKSGPLKDTEFSEC